jgi:hypothetical protein
MQLAAERQAQGTIRANLKYIVDTGRPPVHIIDWPEMEHMAIPAEYSDHLVEIRDGRPMRDAFELDTHGFVFAEHRTQMKDFTDETERQNVYDREVADLIRLHSGASEVVVFDHTIRVGDEGTRSQLKARAPVRGVHNDYTEKSAPQRLSDILGEEEAARRMAKRWAIVQVWRPIGRPVVADPMAICDARTIPEEGFILLQRRYQHRTAEVYHIAYHPAHEWFYFPEMTRDEALVFKVFDSDATKQARFTAHTSFEDPNTPADAYPRESIETRTFAFFD